MKKFLSKLFFREPVPGQFDSVKGDWYFYGQGEWLGPFTYRDLIKATSKCRRVFLMAGGVSDSDLAALNGCSKVSGLTLMSPNITLAATPILKSLPELNELILSGPPITDAFLLDLTSILTLQSITLIHTNCTNESVRLVTTLLPTCKVYGGDIHSDHPVFNRRVPKLFLENQP